MDYTYSPNISFIHNYIKVKLYLVRYCFSIFPEHICTFNVTCYFVIYCTQNLCQVIFFTAIITTNINKTLPAIHPLPLQHCKLPPICKLCDLHIYILICYWLWSQTRLHDVSTNFFYCKGRGRNMFCKWL